jgi:uncharacterized protein (TIGR03066 family)
MKAFRGLLACAAVLLVHFRAFADDKSDAEKALAKSEGLMGKWKAEQNVGGRKLTAIIDFQKGGKLAMNITGTPMGDIKFDGTYKVIDNTIEVTITFMGRTGTEKSKFKVTGDKLELTDKNDKKETFTRVK